MFTRIITGVVGIALAAFVIQTGGALFAGFALVLSVDVYKRQADLDALNASEIDGKTVAALVTEATATIGEKISLRRFVRYESEGLSLIHI